MEQPNDFGTEYDVAKLRLEAAEDDLESAKILLEAEKYKGANNRAYYSIFHAINAIHILNGVSYRKHSEVLGNFNKDYVKTGIFPKDLGRKVAQAEEIRHASDYDDFYIATKSEVEEQVKLAEEFLQLAKEYYENWGQDEK